MMIAKPIDRLLPYLALAAFFAVSIAVRPLLPVDETRYLSVSWEMFLRQNFLVPTLNFEPYFQKPPLLFWLIDLAWSVFGVSRIAAVGVIFVISSLVLYLTQRLATALFPNVEGMTPRVPWLMLGSAVFVIYSSLILFDLLQTLFVLAFFLALLSFANGRGLRYAVLAGIFVGFGVLTKGPVMLIHIACPILLYPLWRNPFSSLAPRQFFSGMALMLLAAVVPVLAWLGPALYQTGSDFAYSLIWRQAAGRVSGNLESAHARPVYFYLLLLPVGLLPWVLSPYFWRSESWLRIRKGVDVDPQEMRILRFLTIWCLAEFVVFSMISGKQPHYLVPLLPPMILIFGYFMAKVRFSLIKITAALMLALFAAGQAIASMTVFPRYDLAQLAAFVAENRTAEWAFSGKYQGELTFLARLEKPFAIVSKSTSDEWLRTHPGGYLVTKASRYPELTHQVVFSQPATRGYLIILSDAPQAANGQ